MGRAADPDRPGVRHALEHDRHRRRRCTRAPRARPSPRSTCSPGTRSCAANPVLERPRRRRRGARRQPAGRRRPQYAIAPIDQCYRLVGLIKSRWEGISGGTAIESAVRGVLRRPARARAGGHDVSLDVDRPRPVPKARPQDPVFTVLERRARRSTRCAPTLRFQLHVSDPEGRAIYAIALSDADPGRPGAPRLRRRRRASGWSSCSARPSAGARRRTASSGRASTRSCRASPGRRRSTLEVPCTYDLEVAASKYFYSLPRRPRAAVASTSPAWCSTATRASSCASTAVPWSCSARWPMPVEAWKRAIADAVSRAAAGSACRRETLDALQRRKAARGPPHLRRDGRRAAGRRVMRRRAGHDAAVGGLRALPVHAGRDEERDADAVRDRLPAGVRGRRPDDVRPRRGCSAIARGPATRRWPSTFAFLRGERRAPRAARRAAATAPS